ncbi:stage II sporulation protein E [Sporolactobacillus sp. CPB3-1]|uniref:Stage II sporulation protein E n=1 Tax=Sporolactobacillus mangiferae TaxID=2940498 RepID=A0ABT0MC78_9BACL|nr:stage II sporulation protein E [Sporolactobacillus mangiferae]MCL1632476.1 stage II sporulation protein E [Sporolactobacillus mangiferae]
MIQKNGSVAAGVLDSYLQKGPLKERAKTNRSFQTFLLGMLFRTDLFFMTAGFLLGRAVIITSLTPFVLPFFATVFWMKRKRRWADSMAVLAGGLTLSVGQAFYALLGLIVFLAGRRILKAFSHSLREEHWLPALVFIAGFLVRLLYQAAFSLNLVWTDVLTGGAEASLSALVTLIFMQSVPLMSTRVSHKLFRNEEIICFVILISSVIAGTIGWHIYNLSVDHVLARYAVLLFAYAGGAAIGSTVGVVIGLILGMASVSSLYQMSLLAFSGVLGGLLKEAGKIGVSSGLLISTLLIGVYGGGYAGLGSETLDSIVAIILFLLTPKSMIKQMASFIPGTREYQAEQQQYVRKLRDVTVSRVEQFAGLFQTLAKSFYPAAENEIHDDDREFLSKVTARTCQNCFKKKFCWVNNFERTQQMMLQLRDISHHGGRSDCARLEHKWRGLCSKADHTLEAIQRERRLAELNEKMRRNVIESRRLVADQLKGVSQVMGDFAGEMKRERGLHEWQEEMILARLNGIGVHVESIEIYNLESGAIDIEAILPVDHYGACEKVIAPLLSDILGESIVVEKKQASDLPGGPSRVVFISARAYDLETGVATAARGGGSISGDNYSLFEIGSKKYVMAISDGMGHGARADQESKDTLQLLNKVLRSGIHETLAIKSINSIMSLRSTEEIYATLDMALIDLQNAKSKFLKIGSNPSFIKRGGHVIMLDAANLPIGMIRHVEVDAKTQQLKSGDLLIMMSDGIFDAPVHIENKEAWVKRKIKELQTNDPQEIADLLLEEVIRAGDGGIQDDMTVIAARINHHIPEWSAFSSEQNDRRASRA